MRVDVALPLPVENCFTYKAPEKFASEIHLGHQVLVPFRNRTLKGIVVGMTPAHQSVIPDDPSPLKEIHSILNPGQIIPSEMLELTKWISQKYACTWGESLSLVHFSSIRKKVMELSSKNDETNPSETLASDLNLTDEQSEASLIIQNAIEKDGQKTFLLFGVTSSGKTEIYLNAIHQALSLNKQALFLVPEISLCQPFFEILTGRFGPRVGIWHSQIGMRDKNILIDRIQNGFVRILVGARSVLFAPLNQIGVIVIDEEHDSSYKQQEKPRYHARDTAIKLAGLHRAIVILGSATPSIESFYRAENKEFTLLKLSKRVPGHSIPRMILVDQRSRSKGLSPISQSLTEFTTVALARREQSIYALNRRGFSTYLICTACGFIWKCAGCQIALIYHHVEDAEFLLCHYCLYTRNLPQKCENCQSQSMFKGGFGTQKIVAEIKSKFPAARILRLDRDVSNKRTAYAKTYKIFREESADILVGTQMVTQGFDFPRVTLVGILDADTALHHPDFRASEKTFQWITQAAGRAGRSEKGGTVVVQSSVPDHYALQSACKQDYESFYRQEIGFRKPYLYPPFSSLVLFRIQSSRRKQFVMEESERLAALLKKVQQDNNIQMLGPGPAPKEVLRKQLRWHILLKCPDEKSVSRALQAVRSFVPKSGVKMIIDVDPYDIL